MGNTKRTQKSSTYIQVPAGCTKAQAQAALYSLFFLPSDYRIIFGSDSVDASLKPIIPELANVLGLKDRLLLTDDSIRLSPITGICEESPEAFASQVFARLR